VLALRVSHMQITIEMALATKVKCYQYLT